jgi:hypothetical protein
MRGIVEIWKGDELILTEPNMLVDGAGELLADVMTVSPSLSGVEDHATSSILDASNYRVNAISFGAGSGAFQTNAHSFTEKGQAAYLAHYLGPITAGTSGNVALVPTEAHADTRQLGNPGYPKAPSPEPTVLQEGCSVPGSWTGATAGTYNFSAVFPANGQLQNFIPSAIVSGYLEQNFPAIAADGLNYVAWTGAASVLGAFPDGSSAPHANKNAVVYYQDQSNKTDRALTVGGFFNEVSSMDSGGFVNMVMSSVPNGGSTGLNFSGGASGLCLSAEAETAYKGFPFVEYTVSLSKDDCLFANAYGGITDLGLWSIDMQKSLENGNTPPFAFSVLNNPRKYKLFCRKGFSINIVRADSVLGYEDLTIKWRIHFR